MKRSFLSVLVILLSACSSQAPSPKSEAALASAPKSFEIFFSRANLLGPTEFEHYKVFNGKIFSECGKILRERNVTESQQLISLEPTIWNELMQSAGSVLALGAQGEKDLDQPGQNKNLFDPGKALFTFLVNSEVQNVAEVPIETSLDSISSPSSLLERNLNSLSIRVRGAAKDTCGNPTFFGMGKG